MKNTQSQRWPGLSGTGRCHVEVYSRRCEPPNAANDSSEATNSEVWDRFGALNASGLSLR